MARKAKDMTDNDISTKTALEILESEPVIENAEPADDRVPVFISSKGIETFPQRNDANQLVPFIYGYVNGKRFEVECNKQVLVKPEVAEAVRGISQV